MSKERDVLEDIYRLFNLAEKKQDMSKRYIELAKKIARGHGIKMPKELKSRYCNKCYSLFNAKNSRLRIKKGFKIIKCLECNSYKRIKVTS